MKAFILSTPLDEIMTAHPYAEDFFISLGIKSAKTNLPVAAFLNSLTGDFIEDCGMEKGQILDHFIAFMQKMGEIQAQADLAVQAVTIIGGYDKSGAHENIAFTMKPGEVVCVVGATGSGKSRLLADIECLAQKDTPTGRQILINGALPAQDRRFSIEHKLVAQLSQNMNFIMDLTVEEFVTMHAESRMVPDRGEVVRSVIGCANGLAGEQFSPATPVTALSGGQSRALMIADTALLSVSPIVLIDEIENAGIDRQKALELMVKKEKIVLMSTHDPMLALLGDIRIVTKNGGISKVISTSPAEKKNLALLQRWEKQVTELRRMLRSGERIEFDLGELLGHDRR